MGLQRKVHPETQRYLQMLECSLSSCLNYSSPNAIHVTVLGLISLYFGCSYSPRICDIVSPGAGATQNQHRFIDPCSREKIPWWEFFWRFRNIELSILCHSLVYCDNCKDTLIPHYLVSTGVLGRKDVLVGRMPVEICFHSGFYPLLCHSMTMTLITSTLYPDLNEYLYRDYAALATSFIYLPIYSTDIYSASTMF